MRSLLPFPGTGQESTFNPPLPPLAQFGALEVKAAWRILDPVNDKAIIPRYYTQSGYFVQQDGTTCQGPALFGLIGLHILRLTPTTPATWFWSTFEQVDNVMPPSGGGPATLAAANTPNGNCTSQYNGAPPVPSGNIPWNNTNPPVNVCQATNISSGVQQVNQNWQSNLTGTVWAYYQLIDTINPSVQREYQYTREYDHGDLSPGIGAWTGPELHGLPCLCNASMRVRVLCPDIFESNLHVFVDERRHAARFDGVPAAASATQGYRNYREYTQTEVSQLQRSNQEVKT